MKKEFKFCPECGIKLKIKGAKFCHECGQGLSGNVELVPSPVPPIVAPWPYIYPPVIITQPDVLPYNPFVNPVTPWDPYKVTCGSVGISGQQDNNIICWM